MKLKYVGNDEFRIKLDRMVHVKNGVEVDFTEDQAKDFLKRETEGKKDWIAATKEAPETKKKGVK